MVDKIEIVMIADAHYLIPTATAICSIIENNTSNQLSINVLMADVDEKSSSVFSKLETPNASIHVVNVSAKKYSQLHTYDDKSPCVASVAALLKFDIAYILNDLDKVLYLDGDIIVKKNLGNLWQTKLGDSYLAAVVDSGTIYFKHEFAMQIPDYFNSGVMLLNLKKMREDKIPELLVETKKSTGDSFFMDQNIFNLVFNGRVTFLPIRYNLLFVNLIRSRGKFTLEQINERYGADYKSFDELSEDATIIHYSSKDKPWTCADTPMADLWRFYFHKISFVCGFQNTFSMPKNENGQPIVSVIIPIFNTDLYLEEAIQSILTQSLQNIEVICVDDGSTDNSLNILKQFAEKDGRIIVISKINGGQSSARNLGMESAKGKYIYFFDSDDLLEAGALEKMTLRAENDNLDLLLFDGTSFFETVELEEKYAHYKYHYIRNKNYVGVNTGESLYVNMVNNGDYKVSPCLQFFSRNFLESHKLRYYEGIIYEDNLFSLQAILYANRVGYTSNVYFRRRVREGSTMTRIASYRNFRSYFICLQAMYLFLLSHHFADETMRAAQRQLKIFMNNVKFCYSGLTYDERRMPWCGDAKERMLSDLLFNSIAGNSANNSQEIALIHASASYKIGRFLTFIPRKLRGGIRCYKEHGWRYTWQRVLVHIGLKKDPYKKVRK